MAVNFKIVEGQNYKVSTWDTAAASTDIAVGDVVDLLGTGFMAFSTALISTDVGVGICVGASTHTASVAGTVQIAYHNEGIEIEGKVTTAANLAQALIGDLVTLDVSGSVQTVDEDDTTTGAITILRTPDGTFDLTNGVHRFLLKANL